MPTTIAPTTLNPNASMASLINLPTPGSQDPYQAIRDAYKQYLGRDPSQDEINSHLGNGSAIAPQNVAHATMYIQNSPEAQAYRLAQAQQAQTQTGAVTTPQTAGTGGTGGTFTATNTGGAAAPGYAYTGFDFNQAASNRDTGRSAKYAFAEATREAAAKGAGDIWKTKEGAERMAEQYIKPFMEARGFQILEIVGDKMRVLTREAAEAGNTQGVWIDWVVNAGGDNPALAWQEEATREAFGPVESRYTQATTPPGTTTPPATAAANTSSTPPVQADVNPEAYAELRDPMASLALY